MMFWYGDGMNGWGWFAMLAGMVLFWGLLITIAVMLFRTLDRASQRSPESRPPTSAEQILGERLARGEIDEEEYRRRLTACAVRNREPDGRLGCGRRAGRSPWEHEDVRGAGPTLRRAP